ncbi:MAG: HAD-IA family hydrolase [Hyphomicrobiales bacterium]|nr:HAD-IA family hydrolase [Hyphomicrobiales bacterium]
MNAALLFDLDGTLVDSDARHMAAFQRILAPYGVALDQALYNRSIHGSSNELIGNTFLPHLSPEDRRRTLEAKEAEYRAGLAGIEAIAGVAALLDYAEERGIKSAVVTNAPRANAEAVLAALGLAARLETIVVGSELERSKPDPLPYLTALALTGAAAARSVAFEDSAPGVRAAAAAGLAVVGLTTTLAARALVAAGALFATADFTDPRIVALIDSRIGAKAQEDIDEEVRA